MTERDGIVNAYALRLENGTKMQWVIVGNCVCCMHLWEKERWNAFVFYSVDERCCRLDNRRNAFELYDNSAELQSQHTLILYWTTCRTASSKKKLHNWIYSGERTNIIIIEADIVSESLLSLYPVKYYGVHSLLCGECHTVMPYSRRCILCRLIF